MSDRVDPTITEFRSNDGRVGGYFEGAHLALLTTVGAKSGLERTAPAMSFTKDGAVYVIASKGGAPEHPAWYHNMLANPTVGVELSTDHGIDALEATAVPVEGPARDALYAEFAADKPGFAEYQKKTTRVIPIMELRRS